MGLDLIEWTYDPMQAMNAHLNFAKLGVVVEEYEENVYGESTSPLHRGNPTDRFVAQWWIPQTDVERRLAAAGRSRSDGRGRRRAAGQQRRRAGDWLESVDVDLSLDARGWSSISRWDSRRCWRARRISRSRGGSAPARSSRPISTAAIAR